MSKKTNYIQAFSPESDALYRIEHHCTDLMLTLTAIAYLLVNDVAYQKFCYNDEKQIDLDSNYIFADDLLRMLVSVPEAMQVLAHPRGILFIERIEIYTYGENDLLWSVDQNNEADKQLTLHLINELAAIQEINEKAGTA